MNEEIKRITSPIDEVVLIETIGDITSEDKKYKYIFAKRLTELMEEKRMTPKILSLESGIKDNTISKYRNGKSEPNLTLLIKLAKALNVSSDYLAGLSEYKGSQIEDYDISKKTGLSYEAIEVLKEYNLKYHNYIPTINFLLEQEMLPLALEKISTIKDTSGNRYKEFEEMLKAKSYIPIIDTIHQYFIIKSKNEELSINNSVMIVDGKKVHLSKNLTQEKNIYTKKTISDEEITNYVFLQDINEKLKQAKQKYMLNFPTEVDNQ
ncbi:MAG: helix-turn-helix transcriptional regulator [Bacilli bacterium]|nr:helix-turn-helix transcriptional regulator [Bacilli bacterium]